MGKRNTKGGAAAGDEKENKSISAKNASQSDAPEEKNLSTRGRFLTEHLKQLEALYQEGLNLEEEILEEEEPAEETGAEEPQPVESGTEEEPVEETVAEEPQSVETEAEEEPAEKTVAEEPQPVESGTEEEPAGETGTEESVPANTETEGDLSGEENPGTFDSEKTEIQEPAEHGGNPEAGKEQEPQRKPVLSGKTGLIQVALFFITLFGISIVGLCMPLRPAESQIEKRTLTEFPEFSWESFLSGDYTDQISTWYADTFPFRETLLSWYTDFKKLFGLQGEELYIGDVIIGDEIPDIPDEEETTPAATDTDASGTDADETTVPEEIVTEAPTETETEEQTETTTETPTEAETDAEIETTVSGSSGSDVVGEQIGSVYIYGDQAFSVYGFSLERSDNYAKMISLAAEKLAGKATVYSILVPLSYGIQLDSSVWESMGWSDEEKAIKYMYSQMSENVKTVSIYQTLLAHKDEYIYFRTDHHWTALGAYYAYLCFADAKQITANALDSFETMTFQNYLGSLYSQSNESEALANNPDTITAYVPHGTNKITITQKDGSILDWRIIYDVTTWKNDAKYSCFIGGDNPFSVIENPEITDGSSVLLVKESFGNAFAPFLVDHYQYVYVIDFRYYSGHLEEVVDTYGIQDVIFMNNLNSAGGTLQSYLETFIAPEDTGSQE